jgi:DNA-binding CsgD family transcriptional regulator
MFTAGPSETAQAARALLDEASGPTFVLAIIAASYSLAQEGKKTEALALLDRGREVQAGLAQQTVWYSWFFPFNYCHVFVQCGELDDAEELATEGYENALQDKSVEAQAFFVWQLALIALRRGHVDKATSHGREAVALFRQLGQRHFLAAALICLASAHALGNDAAEARAILCEHDLIEPVPPLFLAVDLLQARALTAAAAGLLRESHQLLAEAARVGAQIGAVCGEAAALHSLARLGESRLSAPRLAHLAETSDSALIAARARHAEALAARDPAALERVAGWFEELGFNLLAAEAFADASDAWRRANGRRRTAERRVNELLARCPGMERLSSHAIVPEAFTPAERATAVIAATGLSNREIAAELMLSVRTVENRLQRIYEKLGIRSRDELKHAMSSELLNLFP